MEGKTRGDLTPWGLGPRKHGGGFEPLLLSAPKSSTAVHFSPGNDQADGMEEQQKHVSENGDEEEREAGEGTASVHNKTQGTGCDLKVAGGMRRGSEVASWATCGATGTSARDYLW